MKDEIWVCPQRHPPNGCCGPPALHGVPKPLMGTPSPPQGPLALTEPSAPHTVVQMQNPASRWAQLVQGRADGVSGRYLSRAGYGEMPTIIIITI